MDSAEFEEELRPFLLQTTEHFVHELLSFAKAPLDMATYDESVVYPWPEETSHAAITRHGDNDESEGMMIN
jgi:E3 ubiquitin-protein ligase Topors